MLQQFQESHGSSGRSVHANIDINTHYDVIKGVYCPGEFRRPHVNENTVSMEQYGDDYIRLNVDLEARPQIKNKKKQVNVCMQNILMA